MPRIVHDARRVAVAVVSEIISCGHRARRARHPGSPPSGRTGRRTCHGRRDQGCSAAPRRDRPRRTGGPRVHDLIIRNATICDGTGAPGAPRRHRHHRRQDRRRHGARRDREQREERRRADRRRRPGRGAGLHRRAHALRLPAALGPDREPVVVARRHHGRHGQLRLHHRAVPARAPRDRDGAAAVRRGHADRDPARRHQVELGGVPRLLDGARAPGRRTERRRLRRHVGGALPRHGQGRGRARGDAGRARAHARHRARRARGRARSAGRPRSRRRTSSATARPRRPASPTTPSSTRWRRCCASSGTA